MTLSFKYKSIKRPDGEEVKTPSIPVTLIGEGAIRIEVMALIDSGADLSVISQDIAELLNLDLNGPKTKSRGIGGEVDAVNTHIKINIKKGHEDYIISVPVQVILGDSKVPVLIGRAVFFDEFKISFEQSEERILLKKINSNRY